MTALVGALARLWPRAALLAVLLVAASGLHGARAQDDPALANDRIVVTYVPPRASFLVPIYNRLKERQVLEQLKQFLSPLKIPDGIVLKITMKECGETNSWWSGRQNGLFLCYDWLDYALNIASQIDDPHGLTREDAVLGAFLQVIFHELGHAMFDIYEAPVLGREEDAADQMAGLILSRFGPDVAKRTFPGVVYLAKSMAEADGDWEHDRFADDHGNWLQRAYNNLCMAYGADPTTFAYVVDQGLLPKERAANCGREYAQISHAFAVTIYPHIDPEKMKLVQAKQWLRPEGQEVPDK